MAQPARVVGFTEAGRAWPYAGELRVQLPPGDDGTAYTIAAMHALARVAAESGVAQDAAGTITQNAAAGTAAEPSNLPAAAVFAFARATVRFRSDSRGTELVRNPEQMLHEIATVGYTTGDCDELATMIAALLLAGGWEPSRVGFRTIGRDPRGPFQHVYAVARGSVRGVWVAIDPQHFAVLGHEFGTSDAPKRRTWPG